MTPAQPEPTTFEVPPEADGATAKLAGEAVGDGPPIVLLHALSATRHNVVHGSRHLLHRGYRLVAYDARGHGESPPPEDRRAYEYGDLVADLGAVLADLRIERPVLVGVSMGAATAVAFALERADDVAALVQVTPAYTGVPATGSDELREWDRLADALEEGGIERFAEVASEGAPERWREHLREATRQRLGRHRHLDAIANALRVVPRSKAFDGIESLDRLDVPALVVGSRDEADSRHPLGVAREYARRLPHAELAVEDEGESPLAWQGARLSRAVADFLERTGLAAQT